MIIYLTEIQFTIPPAQSPETNREPTPKTKRKLVESNVMVRLKKMSRQSIERHSGIRMSPTNTNPLYHTRNARVAEFKNTNVMTRNRQAIDQIKSPTRRVEHLNRVASALNRTEAALPSPVLAESGRRKTMPNTGAVAPRSPATPLTGRRTPLTTPRATPNVSPSRPVAARSPARYSRTSLVTSTPAVAPRSPPKRQPSQLPKPTNNNQNNKVTAPPAPKTATRGQAATTHLNATTNIASNITKGTATAKAAALKRNASVASLSSDASGISTRKAAAIVTSTSSSTTRSLKQPPPQPSRTANVKPVNNNISKTANKAKNTISPAKKPVAAVQKTRSTRSSTGDTTTTRQPADVRSSRSRIPRKRM